MLINRHHSKVYNLVFFSTSHSPCVASAAEFTDGKIRMTATVN